MVSKYNTRKRKLKKKAKKSRKGGRPGNPNDDGSEFKIPTKDDIILSQMRDVGIGDGGTNTESNNWLFKLKEIIDGELDEEGRQWIIGEEVPPPNTSDRARDAINAMVNIYDAYDIEQEARHYENLFEVAQNSFTYKPAKQPGWWDKATPVEEERLNNFDKNPIRSFQQQPLIYGASRFNNRGEREIWRQGTPPDDVEDPNAMKSVGGSSRKRRRKTKGKKKKKKKKKKSNKRN